MVLASCAAVNRPDQGDPTAHRAVGSGVLAAARGGLPANLVSPTAGTRDQIMSVCETAQMACRPTRYSALSVVESHRIEERFARIEWMVEQLQRDAAAGKGPVGSDISRGSGRAPGKRHRTPVPHERIDKRMGEPVGKKMGQKGHKPGGRGPIRGRTR